jgi:error-prone DNA polymerase
VTPGYVPLWCKSNHSFLIGASTPEELVESADRFGLTAVAITDLDGLYGVVRGHLAAKERGIKLIIGAQITVKEAPSLLLLAKNASGYGDLSTLISRGRMRSPKGESSVELQEVCDHGKELIAIILPPDLPEVFSENLPSPETFFPELKARFPGKLYLGISRHYTVEENRYASEALEVADRLKIPAVALPEVLYHDPERQMLQDTLTCIRRGIRLTETGTQLRPNNSYAMPSPEEMRKRYPDSDLLLRRTEEIAAECTFSLDEITYRYPSEQLPGGYTTERRLRELTFTGAKKRYGERIPHKVTAQLERELAVIGELDYCGYFLTMWDLVEYCRGEGILCQGRGSAANSAVCYCLGITAIDPVRMDLLFERFLSKERAEPPDIDLDIEHRRREEVIAHMYRKYGRDRAAMVANLVRYRPRSAVRDVGKVLGFPETTLDRMAKLLSHRDSSFDDAFGTVIEEPEEASAVDVPPEAPGASVVSLFRRLCREILGFPRHLSIHPGGFLLGSEAVHRIVPVENATMPGRTVIQWDKYDVEAMGLFKVDLLGLGALTHLDYAFRLLKEHFAVELSMATIPPKDAGVFGMLSRGDTVGVFQVESRAQMAMLPRLRPKSFYDLVIEVSIVRPGPITGGMVHPYLRRRNGEERVTYPHPKLEPVLKKTLGVPLFQEQVMKLAIVAADYTPGEADQLRRDMAAWRRSGSMEHHGEKLVSRMVAKGIPEAFAGRVFDQIKGFGEYGFPESHAASFALIAYSTAWMRYHYPEVFVCALLNAWPMGFYAPATIVEDAKRHGVTVLPIDLLLSDWECRLVPLTQVPEGLRVPRPRNAGVHAPRYALRMGLRFVKGLGKGDWERIRSYREDLSGTGGEPRFEGFVQMTRLPENTLAALAQSGALGCFGRERREALWGVSGGVGGGMPVNALDLGSEAVELPLLNRAEEIRWDYTWGAHSTTGHPLEPHRRELTEQGFPDAQTLGSSEKGTRVRYAGLVICRQRPDTAGGTVFITLEDESGFVNLVIRRRTFEEHRNIILSSSFLGVTGRVERGEGLLHLIVESCFPPALSVAPTPVESRDFH